MPASWQQQRFRSPRRPLSPGASAQATATRVRTTPARSATRPARRRATPAAGRSRSTPRPPAGLRGYVPAGPPRPRAGAATNGPYWFSPAQRAGSVTCCVGIASVTTQSRPAWATEPLVRLRSRSESAGPRRVAAGAREPALFDGDAQLLVRAVVLCDGVHLTLHEVVQTVERAL